MKILFRADGNTSIGLGHVVRCLGIAEIVNKDFYCVFGIQSPDSGIKLLIKKYCHALIELPKTDSELLPSNELKNQIADIDVVVLDSYNYNNAYCEFLQKNNCKVVCIDDLYKICPSSDCIINHAPAVSIDKYDHNSFSRLYLGLDYAMVRKEFLQMAGQARQINAVDSVFICFGGVDKYNFTLKALIAVSNISTINNVDILIGSKYPFLDELESVIKTCFYKNIILHQNLEAADIVSILKKNQLAIVPSSTIALEVMCVGMPVILGYYEENQRNIAEGFSKLECCYNIGSYREQTVESLTGHLKDYLSSNNLIEHLQNQKRNISSDSSLRIRDVFQRLFTEKKSTNAHGNFR